MIIVVIAAGHALNSLTCALFAGGLMHYKPEPPESEKVSSEKEGHRVMCAV